MRLQSLPRTTTGVLYFDRIMYMGTVIHFFPAILMSQNSLPCDPPPPPKLNKQ